MRRSPLVILALMVLLGGCGRPQPPAEAKPPEEHAQEPAAEKPIGTIELKPEAAKAAGIVVEEARAAPFEASFTAPGIVGTTPSGRALVTPPVQGRILRLLATVGDPIRKGQPLAVLESVELAERSTAITEARRGLLAAQAEVSRADSEGTLAQGRRRTAEQTLARQRSLARTGAFSQPSLQAAERALSDARATLESSQREAVVHRAQLERSERLYRQELVSRIDVENARLDVEKDRIAQERAQREVDIARNAYERERSIGNQGLLNAREVQAAEADARAARLDVEKARIALRSARAAAQGAHVALADAQAAYAALKGSGNIAEGGRLTVVAQGGGTVVHREASVGQAVERASELFEIDDLREVIVTAQVPEREIVRVRRGARATVTTDAYPGRTFQAVVETIGGRLDPKTRTLPVLCRVRNPDGALRPEMFAQVALGTGANAPALAVPSSAIVEDGDKRLVFVEQTKGKYVRKEVTLGRTQGERVEVSRGLEPGARVVVDGTFTLKSELKKGELKGDD